MATPLEAVRLHCRWCTKDQQVVIRECGAIDCPTHKYRMGKGRGSVVRAIKAKCFDCSGWERKDVVECPVTDCPLYPFRLGKNPNRKRGVGTGNPEALRRIHSLRRNAVS